MPRVAIVGAGPAGFYASDKLLKAGVEVELLDEEWLPGGDELTPTMKLKRKPIAEKYAVTIDRLYEG